MKKKTKVNSKMRKKFIIIQTYLVPKLRKILKKNDEIIKEKFKLDI